AYSEDHRGEAPPDGPHRVMGRRGAGAAWFEGVREGTFRRSGDDGREAGTREARRLLQRRQWDGHDSWGVSAGERSRRADLPKLDGTVQKSRDDDPDDPQYRRHGSSLVRRSGSARISVHSGSGGVRLAHASLQYG